MFRKGTIPPILVSVLTLVVFMVGTTATDAARKDPGLPGNHLVIEEVAIVYSLPQTIRDFPIAMTTNPA